MGSSFKNYIKGYLPGVLNALGDPKVIYDYKNFYTIKSTEIVLNNFRLLNVKAPVNVWILG